MTTYYVDPVNGNDASAGTSWGAAWLTLSHAEATATTAGDTVYFGPGVYRLSSGVTISHAGSSGSPITWIGDVPGDHTDGVGGLVRVTGSTNDTTATASNLLATGANYRTFQGFSFDTSTGAIINWTAGTNFTLQDCIFQNGNSSGGVVSITGGGAGSGHTIERCILMGHPGTQLININGPTTITIQNLLLVGGGSGIQLNGTTASVTIVECAFVGQITRGLNSQGAGASNVVNDSIFFGCVTAIGMTAGTAPTEDYNTFYANTTNRGAGISTGANSQTYPPLWDVPRLFAGVQRGWPVWFSLSEWSQVAQITGTATAADDLSGMTRPATAGKISWGPHQWVSPRRETTTVFTGAASIKLPDAMIMPLFKPVTSAAPLNISAYVYSEANYAGTAPQLVIRQPGQSDTTVTDGGSTGAWNLLTTTVTPATAPQWVEVLLVSNNTATSGSYAVYFDSITITT